MINERLAEGTHTLGLVGCGQAKSVSASVELWLQTVMRLRASLQIDRLWTTLPEDYTSLLRDCKAGCLGGVTLAGPG